MKQHKNDTKETEDTILVKQGLMVEIFDKEESLLYTKE